MGNSQKLIHLYLQRRGNEHILTSNNVGGISYSLFNNKQQISSSATRYIRYFWFSTVIAQRVGPISNKLGLLFHDLAQPEFLPSGQIRR